MRYLVAYFSQPISPPVTRYFRNLLCVRKNIMRAKCLHNFCAVDRKTLFYGYPLRGGAELFVVL